MELKSNQHGFLVGVPIDGTDKTLEILIAIRQDTKALVDSINGVVRTNKKSINKRNNGIVPIQKVNEVRQRNAKGQFVKKSEPLRPVRNPIDEQKQIAKELAEKLAEENAKRIIEEEKKRKDDEKLESERKKSEEEKKLSRKSDNKKVIDTLKDGVDAATADIEKVDPVVEATKEIVGLSKNVKGAFKLLAVPFMFMGTLFKKITGKGKDKEQVSYLKRMTEYLKKILNKESVGGGKGLFGGKLGDVLGFGGIGAMLLALLTTIFSPLKTAAITAGSFLLSSLGKVLNPLKTSFLNLGKQILPILSRAFLPLTGILIAAFSGWKFGDWLYEKYGKQIGEAIDSISTSAKDAFKWVKDSWTALVTSIGAKHNLAVNWLTDLMEKTANKANQAVNTVKEVGGSAVEKINGIRGIQNNKDALINEMIKQGITNPTEQAMILAQTSVETGGFTQMKESLKYSPKRFLEMFKGRNNVNTLADAEAVVAGGEESIASKAYSGRMGNVNQGDALKYIARGQSGLTGKNNYAAAGNALGIDLVRNPELAANPEIGARIALWFYKSRNMGQLAKSGNVDAVTKLWTGGMNAATERRAAFQAFSMKLPKGISPVSTTPMITPPKMPNYAQQISVQNNNKTTMAQAPYIGQNMSDRSIAHIVTGGIGLQ